MSRGKARDVAGETAWCTSHTCTRAHRTQSAWRTAQPQAKQASKHASTLTRMHARACCPHLNKSRARGFVLGNMSSRRRGMERVQLSIMVGAKGESTAAMSSADGRPVTCQGICGRTHASQPCTCACVCVCMCAIALWFTQPPDGHGMCAYECGCTGLHSRQMGMECVCMNVQMHWFALPPDGHRMCVYECANALACTAARRAQDVCV